MIGTINGEPAREHFLARFIEESGFVNTAVGFQMRRMAPAFVPAPNAAIVDSEVDEGNDNDDHNSEDESSPLDTESPHHKRSETA